MPYNTSLTPAQRSERARIAANAKWARLTPAQRRAATAAGLKAIEEQYEDQVDPERLLSPADRARLVRNAREEHLARIRFKSLKRKQAQIDTPADDTAGGETS
jgi:hypothetical protein